MDPSQQLLAHVQAVIGRIRLRTLIRSH